MKEIRYYINLVEAGEPTNPSRRGFLKKAGAGAAVAGAAALDPTGTIVKELVKDLGVEKLTIVNKLLKVATPYEVMGFLDYRLNSGIWSDAITQDEWNDAARRLNISTDEVYDWVQQKYDEDLDALDELSKVIGRPLKMEQIQQVFDKNGIDYDEYDDEMHDIWNSLDALDEKLKKSSSPTTNDPTSQTLDTLKDVGQVASISKNSDKIKTLLKSALDLARKLVNTSPSQSDPMAASNTQATDLTNKNNTPALPAPTRSEYDDLLTPNIDQEKPEFDFWKPSKDDDDDAQPPMAKKI